MSTKKAGCILINKESKKIALVCRNGEFSFPKGHLEQGETLKECAIRETIEETGHNCQIYGEEIAIMKYSTPRGENVENMFYIAIDKGKYENKIEEKDKEVTVWRKFEDVETTLSYENLKKMWNEVKGKVKRVIENE